MRIEENGRPPMSHYAKPSHLSDGIRYFPFLSFCEFNRLEWLDNLKIHFSSTTNHFMVIEVQGTTKNSKILISPKCADPLAPKLSIIVKTMYWQLFTFIMGHKYNSGKTTFGIYPTNKSNGLRAHSFKGKRLYLGICIFLD